WARIRMETRTSIVFLCYDHWYSYWTIWYDYWKSYERQTDAFWSFYRCRDSDCLLLWSRLYNLVCRIYCTLIIKGIHMTFTLFSSNKMANIIIKDHAIRYVGVKQTSPITVQKFREKYLPPGIVQDGRIIERDTLLLILDECVSDWGIKRNRVQF